MARDSTSETVLNPGMLRASGALLSAQIAVSRLIELEAVAPIGQDSTVVDLLVRLDQAPNSRLRAVELSRQLLMSPSHVSRMLDRAETAGLIAREPDPTDRRASLVVMTTDGRSVLREFAPRLEAIIERVVNQTLNAGEIDDLVGALNRITAAACEPCPVEPV